MVEMTWVLLIVSTVLGFDEVKTTHWDTYETQDKCLLERVVLTSTFTQGERALCVNE